MVYVVVSFVEINKERSSSTTENILIAGVEIGITKKQSEKHEVETSEYSILRVKWIRMFLKVFVSKSNLIIWYKQKN